MRHGAGDTLLDSYEAERKPVALANVAQTLRNTEAVKETGWFMPNPSELATIETEEGKPVRDRIAAAVPNQRASVFSHGLQFGTIYRSEAVFTDGEVAPESTLLDYVESAAPGARAPHVEIEDKAGKTMSVLDLFRLDSLVLLTGDEAGPWREAAAAVGSLPVHAIGSGAADFRSDAFAAKYGIKPSGAVLVRPDGYVAWRSPQLPARPLAALEAAVAHVLGRKSSPRTMAS